jgi:2-keto-4-pentenoate hydratase
LALIERRCTQGERQIGWKVGLTSEAIQQQFGFHEPCFGCILETQPSGLVLAAGELIGPGFETEPCVRLGRPLAREVSPEEVRAAVAVVYPSFELTETRGDPGQIALMLADNAQQRSVVLGEPVTFTPALRLDQVEARVELNAMRESADPARSAGWVRVCGLSIETIAARRPIAVNSLIVVNRPRHRVQFGGPR